MAEVDTKERIRQQAHSLIMQYGIRSVSMDDIATSLGISKKTIYHFYSDKDELVEAFVADMISRNQMMCVNDQQVAENALHEVFLIKMSINEILQGMNPSLLFDLQKYHPGGFVRFHKYRTEFLFNLVRQNLLRGISEELYREDLKVDLVARLRVESLLMPFNPEFQAHTSKYTLSEMQQELIDLFLYSIVNPKGYKVILKYKHELEKKIQNNGKIK
ncbi:MAG: TetR/AcrR family transcriptional regulator [Chitinophagaceae bacterium]|nr:TetR/AcrR family transcriptional regulator [Chitinophagaceae bacterium]